MKRLRGEKRVLEREKTTLKRLRRGRSEYRTMSKKAEIEKKIEREKRVLQSAKENKAGYRLQIEGEKRVRRMREENRTLQSLSGVECERK